VTAAVECHPTAVVDPGAELGAGVKIGPYAVIQGAARIGDGCEIGAFVVIDEYVVLGKENHLFPHACVGSVPQDLKFHGEVSYLEVGDRNVFREFVTVNRGTEGGGGVTRIGSDNLFMAYSHVAHDCRVGDHTIFGNAAALGGHVEVGDYAILNAYAAVQQFVRIGEHAYLAGHAGATLTRRQLKRAYRILFRDKLNTTQALAAIADANLDAPEVAQLVAFVEGSERGIVK